MHINSCIKPFHLRLVYINIHWKPKMYFSHSCLQTCNAVGTCSAGFCYIPSMGIHWFGLAEMGSSSVCSCILGIACWPRITSSLLKNKSLNCCRYFLWCLVNVRFGMGRGQLLRSSVKGYRSWLYLQDRFSLCFLMSCFLRLSLQVEIWDSLELEMGSIFSYYS